ncbi:MAG: hypothetical protein EOP09_05360, partial [Proteobacteria bacterium]
MRLRLNPEKLKRLEQLLLALLVVSVLYRTYSIGMSGAHMFRQSDTFGMALATAERIRMNGLGEWFRILTFPRILQLGPLDGVVASEFPLLSFLSAPFLLVDTPRVGMTLTLLLLMVFQWHAAKRFIKSLGLSADPSQLIFLYSSIGIAYYLLVFMPEALGMPLALLGLACFRERKFLRSISLLSLAVLVKPVFVIAFFPLLIERSQRGWLKLSRNRWSYAVSALSVIAGALWYGYHARYLHSHFSGPQIFKQAELRPIQNLQSLGWGGVFTQYWKELGTELFPIWLGGVILAIWCVARAFREIALILGAILLILALDGFHIHFHPYYYVPIGILIFETALWVDRQFKLNHRFNLAFLHRAVFIFGLAFLIRTELWITHRGAGRFEMGEEVRKGAGEKSLILTDDGGFPWKMAMIGRSGWALDMSYGVDVCEEIRASQNDAIH